MRTQKRNEPRHDKTNKMSVHPAKIQIRLGIRPVWSESSLCTHWVAKDPRFLHADSEDSGQTGRMPRLIWVFAGRTLTLLVLSCNGSNTAQSEQPSLCARTQIFFAPTVMTAQTTLKGSLEWVVSLYEFVINRLIQSFTSRLIHTWSTVVCGC